MIGLDTNILVRFLVQDDPRQAAMATSLLERCSVKQQGFLSREVLIELVWVLERAYHQDRSAISNALLGFLEAEELCVEASEDVATAIDAYSSGVADFADHMIVSAALRADCATLYTFDKRAARHNSVTLLVK